MHLCPRRCRLQLRFRRLLPLQTGDRSACGIVSPSQKTWQRCDMPQSLNRRSPLPQITKIQLALQQ